MRVDVVTDDDDQRIDTILNVENQRQNLKELAEKYTSIRRKDYLEWRIRLEDEMTTMGVFPICSGIMKLAGPHDVKIGTKNFSKKAKK